MTTSQNLTDEEDNGCDIINFFVDASIAKDELLIPNIRSFWAAHKLSLKPEEDINNRLSFSDDVKKETADKFRELKKLYQQRNTAADIAKLRAEYRDLRDELMEFWHDHVLTYMNRILQRYADAIGKFKLARLWLWDFADSVVEPDLRDPGETPAWKKIPYIQNIVWLGVGILVLMIFAMAGIVAAFLICQELLGLIGMITGWWSPKKAKTAAATTPRVVSKGGGSAGCLGAIGRFMKTFFKVFMAMALLILAFSVVGLSGMWMAIDFEEEHFGASRRFEERLERMKNTPEPAALSLEVLTPGFSRCPGFILEHETREAGGRELAHQAYDWKDEDYDEAWRVCGPGLMLLPKEQSQD